MIKLIYESDDRPEIRVEIQLESKELSLYELEEAFDAFCYAMTYSKGGFKRIRKEASEERENEH